jgi:hypothetical protein
MGTQRWTCLLAVSLCLAAPLGSAIAALDPDAGDEVAAVYPCDAAEPLDPDCVHFGSFLNRYAYPYVYRGNVYRFDFRAVLKEIKMELAFDGTTDLHVAIHRKQPNGDYKRYPENSSDIVIPNAEGCGALVPHFYSTADADPSMEPVMIEAGFDYAIAFAWGDKFITHGRGGQGYLVPFRAGQVLGLVADNNLSPPPDPLVPETFVYPRLDIWPGVYSMELCFEPQPGACCRASDQRCHEVVESECTGAGSFFHGEYTRCAVTPCIFGACCKPCGTCDNDYAPEACVAAGGVAHWSGVSCPANDEDLCPKITGACCRAGGLCDDLMCRRDCENPPFPEVPGIYHGDGSTCSPDPCKGACCIEGYGCSDSTDADCTAFQGTFRGIRTSCETLLAGQECPGACCYGPSTPSGGFTTCSDVGTRTNCRYNAFPTTAYLGETAVCPTQPQDVPAFCGLITDYHACCLLGTANVCINTTTAACPRNVGDFDSTSRCVVGGCLPAERACCLPNGTCNVLTSSSCAAQGGTWQRSETTCGAGTCVFGACCGTSPPPQQPCTIATRASCEASGKVYRGDGTDCSTPATTCPGFGACCRPDGDCFDDFTNDQCDIIRGTYEQNSSTCSPTLVCDQRGACCAITGTCLFITESQCTGIGDGVVFRGVGVACAANTCPAGACCLPQGCEIRTEVGCTPAGGDYQGDDTECFHDLLPVDPPNCAIDAREPHDPLNAQTVFGWDAVLFALACEFGTPNPGHFQVSVTPVSNETPTIAGIVPGSYSALVTLNRAVVPQEWICLTHLGSGIETCFSLLPGDVNGDRTTDVADIQSLTSKLAGPAIPPPWQCDLDRSGSCTPADILTEVDLLNGADAYDPWLNKSLTVSCPSAP